MKKRKYLEMQIEALQERLSACLKAEPGTVKTREQVIADMAAAMREVAEARTISLSHGFCGLEETCYTLIEGVSPWGLLAEAALRGMCEGVPEESEYTTFRHGTRGCQEAQLEPLPTAEPFHTLEKDYQYFLSCHDLPGNPALREAYYAGAQRDSPRVGPGYHEDGSFERACRETFQCAPTDTIRLTATVTGTKPGCACAACQAAADWHNSG